MILMKKLKMKAVKQFWSVNKTSIYAVVIQIQRAHWLYCPDVMNQFFPCNTSFIVQKCKEIVKNIRNIAYVRQIFVNMCELNTLVWVSELKLPVNWNRLSEFFIMICKLRLI